MSLATMPEPADFDGLRLSAPHLPGPGALEEPSVGLSPPRIIIYMKRQRLTSWRPCDASPCHPMRLMLFLL